jgi:hypothetical protein
MTHFVVCCVVWCCVVLCQMCRVRFPSECELSVSILSVTVLLCVFTKRKK